MNKKIENNKETVHNRIVSWFKLNNWKCEWNEEESVLKWGVDLDDNRRIHAILHLFEDYYTVYTFSPIHINEKNLFECYHLINAINTKMIFGAFEINESTFDVQFKYYFDFGGSMPTRTQIEKSILLPAFMFNKYWDIINDVGTGKNTTDYALQLLNKR